MKNVPFFFEDSVVKKFSSYAKNGRLAHTYLFVGPLKIGKSRTALRIAQSFNCPKAVHGCPCGRCPSCLKIEQGNHPDVFLIGPDESGSIKIEQIRHLITRIQLRPYEAEKKVFIIKDADTLSPEASNALLKTIEEPAGEALVLLTTSFPDRMLPTIKSRCQTVSFFSLGVFRLKEMLMKNEKMDEQTAHFLAFFSEGNIGAAEDMARGGFYRRKNNIIDQFILLRENEEGMKRILADKEKTKDALNVLLSFFRDLLLLKSGVQDIRLVHRDRVGDLREVGERFSFEQVESCLREIVSVREMVNDNFNVKIAFNKGKNMAKIIEVRLGEYRSVIKCQMGEIAYHRGDYVILEVERATEFGKIISDPKRNTTLKAEGVQAKVLRMATSQDLMQIENNRKKAADGLAICQKKMMERKMDMQLVKAEYTFDGTKVIFFFTAEERIDFRGLVKELARIFKVRIELKQIGVRDKAKVIGGFGICGNELCCCSYMKGFHPLSIKMPKEQGLPLNPSRISGVCGRIKCCMFYEYMVYKECGKYLPKVGDKVVTSLGRGKVIEVNTIRSYVRVDFGEGKVTKIQYERKNQ